MCTRKEKLQWAYLSCLTQNRSLRYHAKPNFPSLWRQGSSRYTKTVDSSLTSCTSMVMTTVVKPPLPQQITPPKYLFDVVDTSAPRQLLFPLIQDKHTTPTVDKVRKVKTTLRFDRTKRWTRGRNGISRCILFDQKYACPASMWRLFCPLATKDTFVIPQTLKSWYFYFIVGTRRRKFPLKRKRKKKKQSRPYFIY